MLNKRPADRLGWPDLLEHPFVRETQEERLKREKALADAMELADSSRAWKVGRRRRHCCMLVCTACELCSMNKLCHTLLLHIVARCWARWTMTNAN